MLTCLYVYMFICPCVNMFSLWSFVNLLSCLYAYDFVGVNAYTFMYIRIFYVYVCVEVFVGIKHYTCMSSWLWLYVPASASMYTYAYMYVHMHKHMLLYKETLIYICINMCFVNVHIQYV